MDYIELSNGVKMPQMGYGVYQVSPDEAERCVSDALSVGYRMVDTAQAYANEEGVGSAVKKSGISRDEVFIVSEIWISVRNRYPQVRRHGLYAPYQSGSGRGQPWRTAAL